MSRLAMKPRAEEDQDAAIREELAKLNAEKGRAHQALDAIFREYGVDDEGSSQTLRDMASKISEAADTAEDLEGTISGLADAMEDLLDDADGRIDWSDYPNL